MLGPPQIAALQTTGGIEVRFSKFVAITAIAALALSVLAQGGGPRGGGFGRPGANSKSFLLMREDVQKDLKITAAQKSKLQAIQSDVRKQMESAMQNMRDANQAERDKAQKKVEGILKGADTKVMALLTATQKTRLNEVAIQLAGNAAILDPEVQKKLGMTAAQITKVKNLQTSHQQAMQKLFQQGGGRSGQNGQGQNQQNREQMREKMQAAQKKFTDGLAAVLTAAQKTKLKQLGGKKFEATARRGPGGGGR